MFTADLCGRTLVMGVCYCGVCRPGEAAVEQMSRGKAEKMGVKEYGGCGVISTTRMMEVDGSI